MNPQLDFQDPVIIPHWVRQGGGKIHNFYGDGSRTIPPWFFEGCAREAAESILTIGKKYGNVLLRESVTFRSTGSYVISMRREVAGGTQLNHYEVRRTPQGFKINVDNKHSAMRTLEEVMQFFVRQAGSGTSLMKTNDMNKIGLPGLLLRTGHRGRNGTDDDSGFDDPSDRYDESEEQHHSPGKMSSLSPAPPTWSPTEQRDSGSGSSMGYPVSSGHSGRQPGVIRPKLGFSGNVPEGMQDMAGDIEYTVGKRQGFGRETSGGVPPPPAPPPAPVAPPAPPAPPLPISGGENWSYAKNTQLDNGFANPNLNQNVPPRMMPTQTLQRNAGHVDHIDRGMDNLYLNEAQMNQNYNSYPSTPVGRLPPPLPGGHPTLGGMPPPSPGGFNTTTPNYSHQGQGRSPIQYSANTTPNPRRGGFGQELSFEDELKGRLVSQREQIYSSGATILKSNYN